MSSYSILIIAAVLASASAQSVNKTFLYVWTGAGNPHKEKDFVATIDVSLDTPGFGKVICVSNVPFKAIEPHHAGISIDNKVLAVGGFHGFLERDPSLYFFDVDTDPARPRYIKSVQTVSTIPDDWVRLANGGFLVSLMGGPRGRGQGRIGELDANLKLVAEHPRSGKNTEGLNPHGLWSLPTFNVFVSVDLLDYATTLKSSKSKQIVKRNTVRVWDLPTREILKVIPLPGADSLMDVMAIGSGPYVYVTSGNGWIWGVNLTTYEAKKLIFLYKKSDSLGHCVFSTNFRNGTRLLVSIFSESRILLIDTSVPDSPKILQDYQLPEGAGPHAIGIDPSSKLVTVTSYYLDQHPKIGRVQYDQDRKVRFFKIAADGNSFAPHETVPELDFNRIFKKLKGGANPHGFAYKVAAVPAK